MSVQAECRAKLGWAMLKRSLTSPVSLAKVLGKCLDSKRYQQITYILANKQITSSTHYQFLPPFPAVLRRVFASSIASRFHRVFFFLSLHSMRKRILIFNHWQILRISIGFHPQLALPICQHLSNMKNRKDLVSFSSNHNWHMNRWLLLPNYHQLPSY